MNRLSMRRLQPVSYLRQILGSLESDADRFIAEKRMGARDPRGTGFGQVALGQPEIQVHVVSPRLQLKKRNPGSRVDLDPILTVFADVIQAADPVSERPEQRSKLQV